LLRVPGIHEELHPLRVFGGDQPAELTLGAFYVGLLVGLGMGVAGMMKLIVSQWIMPENSRIVKRTTVGFKWCENTINQWKKNHGIHL
jgi:hypothetical protein